MNKFIIWDASGVNISKRIRLPRKLKKKLFGTRRRYIKWEGIKKITNSSISLWVQQNTSVLLSPEALKSIKLSIGDKNV